MADMRQTATQSTRRRTGDIVSALLGMIGVSAVAGILVAALVMPGVVVVGVTANTSATIFESLPNYITLGTQKQANEIYLTNASGTPVRIARVFDQNRQEIPLAEMSDHFTAAAIAGEDRRFYEHGGIDVRSVARAVIGQAGGGDSGGASTISMQTVRNLKVQQIYNDDTTSAGTKDALFAEQYSPDVGRKIEEMRLAISLEKKYSKDEILEGYLNLVNFGRNTYGVQAASQQYFSVDAADVTPAQAASIIAIVQNPSTKSLMHERNFARNETRRNQILADMHDQGFLTDDEYQANVAIPVDAAFLKPTAPRNGCRLANASFSLFCDYMVNSVSKVESLGANPTERKANFAVGGYKLIGTLDMDANVAARTALREWAPANFGAFEYGAAAATVEVGTGRILVMAQNRDFDDGQDPDNVDTTKTAVNYVADVAHGGSAGFQPASLYKPFTLMSYLEQGHGLDRRFDAGIRAIPIDRFENSCIGTGSGTYKFRNDAHETGLYDVIRATRDSINSVYLQMATKVDQCRTAEIAESFGLYPANDPEAPLKSNPACVIGACDTFSPLMIAGAYAGMAAHGLACAPIAIDAVISPDGTELPGESTDCVQAIDPTIADATAHAMKPVFAPTGTGRRSNPNNGSEYFGKTGTTDKATHTWTAGSSSAASTAVWTGNIVGKQNLRLVWHNGVQTAQTRHPIFRAIAKTVDIARPGGPLADVDPTMLTGQPTLVPDVAGLSVAEAKARIEAAELTYARGASVPSTAPAGSIVSTSPAKGSSVPKGTRVTVVTSDGRGITIPDVSDGTLTFDAARDRLEAAGVRRVEYTCEVAGVGGETAHGMVDRQDPAAGAMISPSTTVTLTVTQEECG